jgi:hypothetical protein
MEKPDPKKKPQALEAGDFYIENGLFVFTEKYHLKRGFCCKSGCRHCPYSKSGQQAHPDR